MQDLMNNVTPKLIFGPIVVGDGTLQLSSVVDLAGYDSCTFLIMGGVLADTDAEWDFVVHEGATSTQAAHTAVADVDLIGTEALVHFAAASDDGKVKKVGYKGGKRYVSIEFDDTVANTGSAPFCIVALLGSPKSAPTANPPA